MDKIIKLYCTLNSNKSFKEFRGLLFFGTKNKTTFCLVNLNLKKNLKFGKIHHKLGKGKFICEKWDYLN